MKIEIEIDVETLVREGIKEYIKENLIIHDVSSGVPIGETIPTVTFGQQTAVFGKEAVDNVAVAINKQIAWEFSPRPGRRRSKEEIALHELELKHNRLLTPEEKGEAKAVVQIDETAEATAKETALNKNRIDGIAKEGMDAASEELAQEEESKSPKEEYSNPPQEAEATIPKADELNIESMFK